MKFVSVFLGAMILCALPNLGADSAAASDLGQQPLDEGPLLPSWETDVDNGDGTWTFTQGINSASTPPHYVGAWYDPDAACILEPDYGWSGFDYYSWFDQDYGWQHSFPHWAHPNLVIQSATLTIRGWDVDSEPSHGWDGEYDGVHVDGTLLDPGYLQGTNATWSVTVFNLPISTILDDGLMDVFTDIDMHHAECWWATTLDYSELEIVYSTEGIPNNPPYAPELVITPDFCPSDSDDLVVTVVGPTPPDPDGDAVTYSYRWFVDIGTGGFLDDEFAGRGDHTGNIVPGADTEIGDIWRVQVTPMDEHGAIGDYSTITFGQIGGPSALQSSKWGMLKALYR